MKTLKFIISKEDLELGDEKDKSPQELIGRMIRNVIIVASQQSAQRGMGEDDRLKYYKISDIFDKAIKENKEVVELEDDWFKLINDSFKNGKLIPSKLMGRIEALVAEVK